MRGHFKALAWALLLAVSAGQAQQQQQVPREIVVGQLASKTHPITGPLAIEYNAGIELAFARVNAAGGIRRQKLRLVVRDDNFDAAQSSGLAQELVDTDKAVALVGTMGTQPLLKMSQDGVLERNSLAAFAPMTGLKQALSLPNVFPVRASYEDEVLAMMRHASRIGRKRIGYLYYDAGVGPHLAKLAPEMAAQAQVELVGPSSFAVAKERAAQGALVAKAAEPFGKEGHATVDAVVLIAVGASHNEALKTLRAKYGPGLPVYSLGQNSADQVIADVGIDVARGVMFTQVVPPPTTADTRLLREFQADLKRHAPGLKPSYIVLEGYIAGRVTADVLARARSFTREGVLEAAMRTGELDLSGYRVSYGREQRRSLQPVEIVMVGSGGKLVR